VTDAHVSQPLEHMQSGSHVCIIVTRMGTHSDSYACVPVTFTIVTAVRVCLSLGSARGVTATYACVPVTLSE
jgi:hypothetical protein